MKTLRWSLFFALLAVTGSMSGCGGDAGEDGEELNLEEFQISSSLLGNRSASQFVAAYPDGRFMAVWAISERVGGGFRDRIAAQRIDASGRRSGPELSVSQPTEFGTLPFVGVGSPVALGPQGEAIFAFAGLTNCTPGSVGFCIPSVFVRRLPADGAPTGPSSLIGATADVGVIGAPSVGMSASGVSVVVWSDNPNQGRPVSTVRAQRLAPDGTKTGSEIVVATTSDAAQVDVAPDGTFFVTWRSSGALRGQRFAADGTKTGAGFVLDPQNGSPDMDVALTPNGEILYVRYTRASDNRSSISMQHYSATGSKLSGEVSVMTGFVARPRLSVAPDGKFAVVWSQAPDGQSLLSAVHVQRFAADGSRLGAAFQANASSANTTTTTDSPAVALAANGRLFVSWVISNSNSVPTVRGRLFAE